MKYEVYFQVSNEKHALMEDVFHAIWFILFPPETGATI